MARFESEESVFNFAVEYLKGIKQSLECCKALAMQHNTRGWINQLRIVYRELSVKTNEEEDEDFEKLFEETYNLMKDEESEIENHSKIMRRLDALEIKLRKTLQNKGMLLPSKADPRFAILER